MKLGLISGNRLLPILLAKNIKEKNQNCEMVVIAFKGETSHSIIKYADRTYWIEVGKLTALKEIIKKENLKECIMAGQINPLRIFDRSKWDKELLSLVNSISDFRPHNIFLEIIKYLKPLGVTFLDSTIYLKELLADEGIMNDLSLNEECRKDIDFTLQVISKFVELDVGQTIVVKKNSVVALETLEGTDRTILRGAKLAGKNCVIAKFAKENQDLRFDVPVTGISTLKLLKKIKASSLVLEKGKVLILEKRKFLSLAKKWNIPVIGKERCP